MLLLPENPQEIRPDISGSDSKNDISEPEMLQIARELKGFVNEVGFIFQSGENRFDLKYYSAEREVDFCGHATIAIMYDLIKNNEELMKT